MTLGAVVLLFVERYVFVGRQAREKLLLRGSVQYILSVVWVRMIVVRNSICKPSILSKYSLGIFNSTSVLWQMENSGSHGSCSVDIIGFQRT